MGYYLVNNYDQIGGGNVFWDQLADGGEGKWTAEPYLYSSNPLQIFRSGQIRSKLIAQELPFRVFKSEHLAHILAEHAITKKPYSEIVDKHDYGVWE